MSDTAGKNSFAMGWMLTNFTSSHAAGGSCRLPGEQYQQLSILCIQGAKNRS
jgi:hypothetical protein